MPLHFPYDEERPLLLGTLSWSDYQGHAGSLGRIEHIQVETENNAAQLGNRTVVTNLYSTCLLIIENCSLTMNVAKNTLYATNVVAEEVSVMDSDLKGEGGTFFSGIETTEFLYAEGLHLSINSYYPLGIETNQGFTHLFNSKINVISNTGGGYGVLGSYYIQLENVNVDVSINKTSEQIVDYYSLTGISSLKSDGLSYIQSSSINVDGYKNPSIVSLDSVIINGSTLSAQASKGRASGIAAAHVYFSQAQSELHLSSSIKGKYFIGAKEFTNESLPPSVCQINDEPMMVCSK